MSDILTSTLAQAITWLTSFGIAAGISYLLNRVEWDERLEKAINVVAVALLTALVTAVSSLIPPTWMDKTVLSAIIAIVTGLLGFGGAQAGSYMGRIHNLNLRYKEAEAFELENAVFFDEKVEESK